MKRKTLVNTNRLMDFPVEGILVDVLLAICIFLILPGFQADIQDNLGVMLWFAAPLQCLAIFFLSLTEASEGTRHAPMFRTKWLNDGFLMLHALALILTIGSFMWFFLPALAIKEHTGIFPIAFIFCFVVSLFGGMFAYFHPTDRLKDACSNRLSIRFLSAFVIFSYLLLTETLLKASVALSDTPAGVVLLVMIVAYFPIRFLFSVREPFSKIDLASGLIFSGLFFRDLVQGP